MALYVIRGAQSICYGEASIYSCGDDSDVAPISYIFSHCSIELSGCILFSSDFEKKNAFDSTDMLHELHWPDPILVRLTLSLFKRMPYIILFSAYFSLVFSLQPHSLDLNSIEKRHYADYLLTSSRLTSHNFTLRWFRYIHEQIMPKWFFFR